MDLPTRAQITDAVATKTAMKTRFGDQRDFVAQLPGGAVDTELTIAAGAITPTQFLHRVDTEADAAADDLDNILTTNLPDGSQLKLVPENAARVVTFRHQRGGAGELILTNGENFAFNDANAWIRLRRKGTQLIEVMRSTVFGRRLGGAVDAAATRTLIDAPGKAVANTFTADQAIQSADAGAGEGPALDLDRASASPAANDLLGAVRWKARDSGAGTDTVAKLLAQLLDATAGSEDAQLDFHTIVAGTLASRMLLINGLVLGAATGGDQGLGKINAKGFYKDGVEIGAGNLKVAILHDEKADGTHGGGTTGAAWTTRDLNTEHYDPNAIVTLASNLFTPIAGTYLCQIRQPFITSGGLRLRLYNNTAASVVTLGPATIMDNGGAAFRGSFDMFSAFTANGTDAYAAQYYVSSGRATEGAGAHDQITVGVETYTVVTLIKIA